MLSAAWPVTEFITDLDISSRCLFSAKSFCQLDPYQQAFVKFQSSAAIVIQLNCLKVFAKLLHLTLGKFSDNTNKVLTIFCLIIPCSEQI